jgi:hypothetical protein
MADVALNFSDLRDEIELYNLNKTKTNSGGFDTTRVLAFKILAKVTPKGSVKSDTDTKIYYEESFDILIRRETGFIPNKDQQVKYEGSFFKILGIQDINNRGKVLKLVIAKNT